MRAVVCAGRPRESPPEAVLMPLFALGAAAFFVAIDELPRLVLVVFLAVIVVVPILQWLVDHLRNKTNRYVDGA